MPPANCPPLPLTRTCCHAARSVDDFKQGTLAEALDLLNKKEYETEEGAQNMIERIWCFEDHCPTPALGFYEGNLEWAKEVRPGVCVHTQSAHWAHTRHTHGTCVHVCTRAPHTFTCVYSAASPAATTPIWHIAPDISRVSISHLPPLPPPSHIHPLPVPLPLRHYPRTQRCVADAYSLLGFVYRKKPKPEIRRAETYYRKVCAMPLCTMPLSVVESRLD